MNLDYIFLFIKVYLMHISKIIALASFWFIIMQFYPLANMSKKTQDVANLRFKFGFMF